jgi:methylated-DNA-[protein]-cysteine S-methyltransferase
VNQVNSDGVLIEYAVLASPLGTMALVAREKRLISLDIAQHNESIVRKQLRGQYPGSTETMKPFGKLERLLHRFLKGEKVDFEVAFDLGNMGDFSRRVLLEVKKIPHGRVLSYHEIDRRLGYPMAARAVGQAVGRNPIPIVIPCHRVIRSDGSLGGFGMGLDLKERLLALEGVRLPQRFTGREVLRFTSGALTEEIDSATLVRRQH